MLNPQNCQNGQEQFDNFLHKIHGKVKKFVQYDYRHTDGQLFSTVKPTLDACRQAKDNWLKDKECKI